MSDTEKEAKWRAELERLGEAYVREALRTRLPMWAGEAHQQFAETWLRERETARERRDEETRELLTQVATTLEKTNDRTGQVITTLEKSAASNDRAASRLITLTWSLVVLTVLLISLGFATIMDARDSASLQNDIALNSQFYAPQNIRLIYEIEAEAPILMKYGGLYTKVDLDTYLGFFEIIKSAYDRHLLHEADLCLSFSYYIEITNKNKEVREYIADQQKIDSGFFKAFDSLVQTVAKSKDPNCHAEKR